MRDSAILVNFAVNRSRVSAYHVLQLNVTVMKACREHQTNRSPGANIRGVGV